MQLDELYPTPALAPGPPPRRLVIYHRNCADGFSAAWAAWRAFGSSAEYLPADHANRPVPRVVQREVYILDFSYPRAQLLEMAESAASILLLDHHKTAAQELAGLPFAHFDLERCGALLAWSHFHPALPVPRFLQYINDRDLARWWLPESRPFLSWLEGLPRTFTNWDRLAMLESSRFLRVLARGERRLIAAREHAKTLARRAQDLQFAGLPARILQCAVHEVSDVGPLLATTSGALGLCWSTLPDARVRIAMRGVPGVDVGAIAREFGGGGHPFAAEFRTSHEQLQHWLRQDATPAVSCCTGTTCT